MDDPWLCPCKALGRLVIHLRRHNAPPLTPIHQHYHPGRGQWFNVKPTFITNALRHAATAVQDVTGIDPSLVSARSLRPGGATALLCAGIDSDSVRLLGRWKSDAMLRYLRIQAAAHANNFAQKMLDHGAYTFHGTSYKDAGLPEQAPPALHLLAAIEADDDSDDDSDAAADE